MKKLCLSLVVISLVVILTAVSREQVGVQVLPEAEGPEVGSPVLKVNTDFGRMPLYFIANQGQMDGRVAYYIQGKDKTIYFTQEGLTLVLAGPKPGTNAYSPLAPPSLSLPPFAKGGLRGKRERNTRSDRWVVKLDFIGVNPDVKPVAEEKTTAVISYFKGKPEEWKTGLPTYSKIVYRDLWPGIDLVYSGTFNKLKCEFMVHPDADPSRIRLAYRGVTGVAVTQEGRLEVKTPQENFFDDVPAAHQSVYGQRVRVDLAYKLNDGKGGEFYGYGFEVGEYDRTLPLVLDPAFLVYCGYIGGAGDDYGNSVAVDHAGNAYITGQTWSSEATFPVTVGPDLAYHDMEDVYVAKVNSSGTGLSYCGYIGGSGYERPYGIAIDDAGNAYVMGYSNSTEATFPVTTGPDLTYNGGEYDAFVAKVDSSGSTLSYCGYIGGSGYDVGDGGIAVDGAGNAYLTGVTDSTEATFPIKTGPDLTYNGGNLDGFVAKVDSSGSALSYCGYIGGSNGDGVWGIAVDSEGNAYLVGWTESTEATFPVKTGPDLIYNGGSADAFVAKVNPTGEELGYCGYIGGTGYDIGAGIAVDNGKNTYIVGWTDSTEATFPVMLGPDLTYNGGTYDAYVAKVDASGAGLLSCGYIGGSGSEYGAAIALDGGGSVYITGSTESTEATFPVVLWPNAPGLDHHSGSFDAFMTKLDPSGTALILCGYIGGSGGDYGSAVALDGGGNAYIVGSTESTEDTFPETGIFGPDPTFNGGTYDAFVAKMTYRPEFTRPSKNLSSSPAINSRYPKVATDPATNAVFVIWVETSGSSDALYFSKSTNGGTNWPGPHAISGLGGQILANVSHLEDDYAIALAVDNPYVHVVLQKRSSEADDFEIFYLRSTDLGASWESLRQLTNNATPSMHPDVAASAGYVHICYEDSWPGNNEIMYKRIANNGGGPVDQTRRLTTGSGDSTLPSIAASKNGDTVHVVYQDDYTGQDQVYYKHIEASGSGAFTTRALTTGTSFNGLADMAVSTGADDQYVYIAYQALWPGNMEIIYKRLGSHGHAGGSLYTVRLTYSTTESSSPAVFFDPGYNRVYVLYHDLWPYINNVVIYRQLEDYGGGSYTGWRISYGTRDTTHAAITGSGGLVYAVWAYNTDTYGLYDVQFKKSN